MATFTHGFMRKFHGSTSARPAGMRSALILAPQRHGPKSQVNYAAPIGAFFCPEIRSFTGFGARFLQPLPKSLVTIRYYSSTKMAINGR